MRNDCTIDDRKVIAPNASLLGYGKRTVKRGDCFRYEGRIARSLGRVTCEGESYVLAMVLSENASYAYERWIKPELIDEVFPTPTKLIAWFFAEQLPYAPQTIRRLMEHGTCADQYIDRAPDRIAAWSST